MLHRIAIVSAMLALLAATRPAGATEILGGPSATATTYAVVVVDTRKLKTSLAAALAAFPNEECTALADANVVPACPGVLFTGVWTYASATGFPSYADPNDPRKALRIDGLREKNWTNFRTPLPCVGNVCGGTPPPEAMDISFTRPTVEFGFEFEAAGANGVYSTGLDVTVNGTYIGFYPVQPGIAVQYFGIRNINGLQSIHIEPRFVDANGNNFLSPLIGGRFHYR
jgi:hypothetical protein